MMCIRNHTFGYSFRYMANILMTVAHRFLTGIFMLRYYFPYAVLERPYQRNDNRADTQ